MRSPLNEKLLDQDAGNSGNEETVSYSDLFLQVVPSWAGPLPDICLLIYSVGALVTYFLFFSTFVHHFPFWPRLLSVNITNVLVGIVCFICTLPRDVSAIGRFGSISLFGILLMALAIWVRFFQGSVFQGHAKFDADTITAMYEEDDWLFICVRLALSTALLVAIPLNMYPARESCLVLVKKFKPNYQVTYAHHVLLGFILVLIIIITAVLFPNVTAIITFLGGFLANLLMLVFPAIIGKKVFSHRLWLALLVMVTVFSIFVALAAFDIIGLPVKIS